MLIGGLQKTSLLDYPDQVSAIIFTVGCNFRCGFCYNSHLVTATDQAEIIPEQIIWQFLESRRKKIAAVVITGGEPTLHSDLSEFLRKIKGLGYLVKLDTNGTNPSILKKIIKARLVDYLAMDIKAPLPNYVKIVNVKAGADKIKESVKIIMSSGLPYEFRSTILPALHTSDDLLAMSKLIAGAEKYFLQKFMPTDSLNDKEFKKFKSFTDAEMDKLAQLCAQNVKYCAVR